MTVNPYGWAGLHTTFTDSIKSARPAEEKTTEHQITRDRFQQAFYDYKANRLSFEQHYKLGYYIDIKV